jgi:very-short-patch-repair endonuclease
MAKRRSVTMICQFCEGAFVVPERVAKRNREYCSKSCAARAAGRVRSAGRKPKLCLTCGTVVTARGTKIRHCSHKCAGVSLKKRVTKNCLQCGTVFEFKSSGETNNNKRRFCGGPCAAEWRMAQPGRAELSSVKMHAAMRLKWATDTEFAEKMAKASSERMKARNPTRDPAVIEKMRRSLAGRTFLSRGGNGQLTEPQKMLAAKLRGSIMELAILTAPVRGQFPSLPAHYKVDIALPRRMLAIEVDGNSHKQRKWKFLDARKTEVLNALGWSVLRFSNEAVLTTLPVVLATIRSFTTSKSPTTTTILRKAS